MECHTPVSCKFPRPWGAHTQYSTVSTRLQKIGNLSKHKCVTVLWCISVSLKSTVYRLQGILRYSEANFSLLLLFDYLLRLVTTEVLTQLKVHYLFAFSWEELFLKKRDMWYIHACLHKYIMPVGGSVTLWKPCIVNILCTCIWLPRSKHHSSELACLLAFFNFYNTTRSNKETGISVYLFVNRLIFLHVWPVPVLSYLLLQASVVCAALTILHRLPFVDFGI